MRDVKANLTAVELPSANVSRFEPLLEETDWRDFVAKMRDLSRTLRSRIVWNVNSTAKGGGVAEMLAELIKYSRGVGIDERWLVIEGSAEFFEVTKRIHKLLHGAPADGIEISPQEKRVYESVITRNAEALVEQIRPGDVVIIHDPQAAGLVPSLARHGAHVIWRSHVGVDEANDIARTAWRFLSPYLDGASGLVFSRPAYVWEGLDASRVGIIPPCIDPFATKNDEMSQEAVSAVLKACGIVNGRDGEYRFVRSDGAGAVVTRKAKLDGDALPDSARFILQVSRWDELKDPVGVMEGFVRHIAPRTDRWLVLAGPKSESVADDPEQREIISNVLSKLRDLDASVRQRVVVAQLPMEDADENAAIVNALQRRADVVVQKSLAEGFGLTVAEAMWKERPVVASRVGGIQDQIEDGKSGLLIEDPKDLAALGEAVVSVLGDRSKARSLGVEARKRVAARYLPPRALMQQAELITPLVA